MDQEPVAAVSKLKTQPRRTKGRKTPDHQHTTSGALVHPELGSSRQLPVGDAVPQVPLSAPLGTGGAA